MKTYVFKSLILVSLIALFAIGCEKPIYQNVGPTLEFVADTGYISTDTLWAAGDTAIIALRCISNGTDAVRTIYINYNSQPLGNPVEIDVAKGEDFTYELKITKNLTYVEKYNFEVVDSRGHSSEIGLIIRIDETGGEVSTVNALLGAQGNPSIGSYFSFIDGKNHTRDFALANMSLVDMIGGYDFVGKCFLSSPGSDNTYDIFDFSAWPTRNLTEFCKTKLSTLQYDMINKDNLLISSFHPDEATNIIQNLKANEIYSFKTQNNRYGLIYIINGATGENGHIIFDYKIQVIPPAVK